MFHRLLAIEASARFPVRSIAVMLTKLVRMRKHIPENAEAHKLLPPVDSEADLRLVCRLERTRGA